MEVDLMSMLIEVKRNKLEQKNKIVKEFKDFKENTVYLNENDNKD
jgi:hypothetical protein